MDEMDEKDIELLFLQIKTIIFNKPTPDDLKTNFKNLKDLQQSIEYLENFIKENNRFLCDLALGNLESDLPNKYNFLSNGLKQLYLSLKNLAWQANQVANGDYSQRVVFLGEFSTAFNKMVEQLEERENKLKAKTIALTKNIDLMVSIMDGLEESIVVTDEQTADIIYVNKSAKILFNDINYSLNNNYDKQKILSLIQLYSKNKEDKSSFEFHHQYKNRLFHCKSFLIQWNDKTAYVHFLSDLTNQLNDTAYLTNIAYKDELTGLFNRRYFLKQLFNLIDNKKHFSIAMIDIDGLKIANDDFGHLEGDFYIKTVANELLSLLRDTDILARIGGDEFIAILPKCSYYSLEKKLKKLNENLANINKPYNMSASYGIEEVFKDNILSAEKLLEIIDKKMYAFKKERKNKEQS